MRCFDEEFIAIHLTVLQRIKNPYGNLWSLFNIKELTQCRLKEFKIKFINDSYNELHNLLLKFMI